VTQGPDHNNLASPKAGVPLLAELSHELRTPLGAILGFADAMRSRAFGPLSDTYAEHAEVIRQAGLHMLSLIDDLTELSRLGEGRRVIRPEDIDAAEVLQETAGILKAQAKARGVDLTVRKGRVRHPTRTDHRMLAQILLNLGANALKFTPAGGRVTMSAESAASGLVLTVKDTGAGIEPADLPRVTGAYEQAGSVAMRAGGEGLGLALVEAYCAALGGTVSIEGNRGGGTTATVRLPPWPGEG
jgi:two-component system, cell cycle sensor histidine kinase DivJ